MLRDEHADPNPGSLTPDQARTLLQETPRWQLSDDGETISRTFQFRNFYETMAFANAVAWEANQEDHHPDLELSYKRCVAHFTTHSVDGLSRNDFILAARVDAFARE